MHQFLHCKIKMQTFPIKHGPFNAILEAEGVLRAILDISEILSGTKNWINMGVLNQCFFQNQRPNHLVIIKRGICTLSCSLTPIYILWWSFCRFFKKPLFGCSITRSTRCGGLDYWKKIKVSICVANWLKRHLGRCIDLLHFLIVFILDQ